MIDFELAETRAVTSQGELVEALTGRNAVRLAGQGSTQHRIPPPTDRVALVETKSMNRVTRLDAADLTCSVEPGVTLEQLSAELAEHRLCLPVVDSGTTLGGIFARGARTALAPGGHDARSLVLGFEGVLAEGSAFKAGARVVKSVAGFDLPKLFVGSRGRLFAVSLLHLKLRPMPERAAWFHEPADDATRAITRFRELRAHTPPLACLVMRRESGAWTISGSIAGRGSVVARQLEEVRAREATPPAWRVEPAAGQELVSGGVAPRALERFVEALSPTADVVVTGGMQFDVAGDPSDSDSLLEALSTVKGTCGAITRGSPERRRRTTPAHPAVTELEQALRGSLDPRGVLQ